MMSTGEIWRVEVCSAPGWEGCRQLYDAGRVVHASLLTRCGVPEYNIGSCRPTLPPP
jgi:hypothetical protein